MNILCFGDSNTYGYDPCSFTGSRYAAANRWPEILAAEMGREVVNAGENGREIPRRSFELESVSRLIACHKPDLIIVMLGTNDLLQGAKPAEVAFRMEAFLQFLFPLCPKVLLVVPPALKRGAWVPTDALVDASYMLGTEYTALAKKLGVSYADASKWELSLAFDGVHLTEEGHHQFAENMKKAVVF